MWASVIQPTPRLRLTRERWDTPDDDFIDIDRISGKSRSPILIALHGLEGSSRSKQVINILHIACQRQWYGFGINFRSCSGELNRLRRSYHAGETSDLHWILQKIVGLYPESPIFCIGFSLGGNILLKYLGEIKESAAPQLKASVAVSVPFDLSLSVQSIEKGLSRIYMKRFVRNLKRKTFRKLKQFPDLVDVGSLKRIKTLSEFDDIVTAPTHGFPDAKTYWDRSSSLQFLPKIRRPTLLINAKDDPFFPGKFLPNNDIASNPYLSSLFPERGGHAGFYNDSIPRNWAENCALLFLESHLSA